MRAALVLRLLAFLAWGLHAPLLEKGVVARDQGAPADATLMVWNAWWLGEALSEGKNPWRTDRLSAPRGENLALYPLAVPGLVVMRSVAGADPSGPDLLLALHVTAVISSFVVGALGLGLGGELGLRGAPRLLLAVLLMTVELRMANVVRMHVMMTETLVLFVWMTLRWVHLPTPARALHVSGAFVLLFLSSFEYAYFVTILLGPFLAWRLVRGLRHREIRALPTVVAALGPLLLLWPFLAALTEASRAERPAIAQDEASYFSADALDLVLPPAHHLLWSESLVPLQRDLHANIGFGLGTSTLALGLALYALLSSPLRRGLRPWIVVGALAAVAALGPSLRVLGTDTGIPLPYALGIEVLPFFSQARSPMRYWALATLALAIIAAFGARRLLAGCGARARGPVAALLLLVAGAEGLRAWNPQPCPESLPRAPFAESVEGQLVEIPDGREADLYRALWHQVAHQRPLATHVERMIQRAGAEELSYGTRLRTALRGYLRGGSEAGVLKSLIEEREVRWLVVHAEELVLSTSELTARLAALGFEPVAASEAPRIFVRRP